MIEEHEQKKRIEALRKAGLSEGYNQGIYHYTQYDGDAKLKTVSGAYEGDAQSIDVKGSAVTNIVTLTIQKMAQNESSEGKQRKPAVKLEMSIDVAQATIKALQNILGKLEEAEKVVGK